MKFVVFRIEKGRYAFPIDLVHRIVRSVKVTELPNAPAALLGLITIAGQILPVINLRRRLHLPERPVRARDQFMIIQAGSRTVVAIVDEAEDVVDYPDERVVPADAIYPDLGHLTGALRLEDGIVFLYDLGRLVSTDDPIFERALEEAVKNAEGGHAG